MRLTRVEIQDYRSVFADDSQAPLVLDLATGMNTLVGPNNCGKSNVLRAIALALDPQYPFDPAIDTPAPRRFAYPIVSLHFEAHPERPMDKSVLEAANAYEASLGVKGGYAAEGRVVLSVAYEPFEAGQRRRECSVMHDMPVILAGFWESGRQ